MVENLVEKQPESIYAVGTDYMGDKVRIICTFLTKMMQYAEKYQKVSLESYNDFMGDSQETGKGLPVPASMPSRQLFSVVNILATGVGTGTPIESEKAKEAYSLILKLSDVLMELQNMGEID